MASQPSYTLRLGEGVRAVLRRQLPRIVGIGNGSTDTPHYSTKHGGSLFRSKGVCRQKHLLPCEARRVRLRLDCRRVGYEISSGEIGSDGRIA